MLKLDLQTAFKKVLTNAYFTKFRYDFFTIRFAHSPFFLDFLYVLFTHCKYVNNKNFVRLHSPLYILEEIKNICQLLKLLGIQMNNYILDKIKYTAPHLASS